MTTAIAKTPAGYRAIVRTNGLTVAAGLKLHGNRNAAHVDAAAILRAIKQ